MDEADKKSQDRDNFHPVQNIHFRLIGPICNIGNSDTDNDGYHEGDPHNRIDKVCRSDCQKNSLIHSPCFIEDAFSS